MFPKSEKMNKKKKDMSFISVKLKLTQMPWRFFPLPVLPAHVRDSISDPSVEIHVVLRIEL